MNKNETLCPVCGYNLGFQAWKGESASDEICPCCGIQFGYDDASVKDLESRKEIYSSYRSDWIQSGMKWHFVRNNPPRNWNPAEQLKNFND